MMSKYVDHNCGEFKRRSHHLGLVQRRFLWQLIACEFAHNLRVNLKHVLLHGRSH
jgi:hypothetical protein